MPINRDLSDLPKARTQDQGGFAPDPSPTYGLPLSERWWADEQARDNDRLARFRHSDAGACARAIAYAALNVPETDPMDEAGVVIARMGTEIHQHWQVALAEHDTRTVEVEVKVVHENEDGRRERGGHIDAEVLDVDEDSSFEPMAKLVVIEAKTVGGFKYKMAIGCPPVARSPKGPSYEHILQASLNAKARNADEAVVLYISREAVSKEAAARNNIDTLRRFMAQWTFDRETCTRYADLEIQRITGILGLVDRGELPKRRIPDPELPLRHLIVNPSNGTWAELDDEGNAIDGGTTWHCNYCRYQTLCATHPADRCGIEEVGL